MHLHDTALSQRTFDGMPAESPVLLLVVAYSGTVRIIPSIPI